MPIQTKRFYWRGELVEGAVSLWSGRQKGNQFLFMDYDGTPLEKVKKELEEILKKFKLRRGIVVQSSPGNLHVLSFSPQPYKTILEIMRGSSCDKNHLQYTTMQGRSALRISRKQKEGIVKLMAVLENDKGTNFYNYWREEDYLALIGADME